MKKKVLMIVIPIILVVVIAAAVIVGYLVLNNGKDEEEESVGSKWGDTYYAYLVEAISEDDETDAEEKYGIIEGMKNATLHFLEALEGQDPTMIMTYEKDDESYVNVYQVNKNKVNYIAYKQPAEVKYLYNIEKEKYSWYICTSESENDSYISLENVVKSLKENATESEDSENVSIAEIEAEYTIKKEEKETKQETIDGTTIEYSKFDEIFVDPEIELNEGIEFDEDIKKSKLKESITTAVEDYKEDSKKVTDDIKETVAKRVEEINKAKEAAEKNNTSTTTGLTPFEYDESANYQVTEGIYYRDKGTGTESSLEITNSTNNSFDFKISAIYMTSAGYPNFGEAEGTAKAIKGGNYVYTSNEYGYEVNIFFKIADGSVTVEDECYNHNQNRIEEMNPFCGMNVTLEGMYIK